MALKLTVKPGETVYLGTNKLIYKGGQAADLYLVGDLPVVRERHFMSAEAATTDARRVYLAVQTGYLTGAVDVDAYQHSSQQLLADRPETAPWIALIGRCLGEGDLLGALKAARDYQQHEA